MPLPSGRKIALSLPRRFVGDLVRCARSSPLMTVERRMDLARMADARENALGRPGWCALFTKAFALVATRRPALRRAYIAYPRPHLYEHPFSIASVAVARPVGDEEGVFFIHSRAPERQDVRTIDSYLRRCKERPLEDVGMFRRVLQTSRWPLLFRRLVWWWCAQWSGFGRARHLGTFGVSVVSNFGAASPHLLTPVTSALNYGVVAPNGSVDVYLTFDQRVLTAGFAARALEETERELKDTLPQELASGGRQSPEDVDSGD
jgi:hypothetical protein